MTALTRIVAVLAVALATAAVPAPTPAAAQTAPPAPTAGQSTYTPATPVRLLDTRESGGRLGPGGTRQLQVAGTAGVPAQATAVALSVTVLGGDRSTDVKVYPGPTEPGASSLVVPARGSASTLVVVAVGEGGRVVFRNAGGQVHVIADLAGHYAEGPGSTYVPATPVRLLDTRTTAAPLEAGRSRRLAVAGREGVPADATAVALNLTALGATAPTDVAAYPARPGEPPFASNLNPRPGQTVAVAAVVALGEDGAVDLRSRSGRVHLVADLQGWFTRSTAGASVFHPLAPRRLADTRGADGRQPRQAEGAALDVTVAGAGAVPSQATGVALTVTALGASRTTDVRVFPVPQDRDAVPFASNLNVSSGGLVANTVLAAVGADGLVRVKQTAGAVHLVVDLVGWFGPVGRGWDISWPQCRTAGSTQSLLPDGGAFYVVGVNRGRPYSDNTCFGAQYDAALQRTGEAAVYLNVDAPGPQQEQWRDDSGPRPCDGTATDADCAFDYGWGAVQHALGDPSGPVRATGRGGKPFVWLDVEDGSRWQSLRDNPNAVAVNRGVVNGMAARLRELGYRYGLYTDRISTSSNDWFNIMGRWNLPDLQVWVFRAETADPRPLCTQAESSPGGPVVMVQVQPPQSGEVYDVDDLC